MILHIIGLILKIIGIILLVILGILLLLIGIVLFVPLRYELSADFPGKIDEAEGALRISWLLHLLSGKVVYKNGNLKWQGRIAWKKFGDVPEREQKVQKSVEKSIEKKSEASTRAEKKVSEHTEPEKHSALVSSKPQLETKVISEKEKEETEQQQSETRSNKKLRKRKKPVKALGKLIRKISQRIQAFLKKIKCTWKNICDKIKKIIDKKDKILAFLEKENHKAAFEKGKKELVWIRRFIKPKKLKARVHFGFEDPYHTGQALAFGGMLYAFIGENVELEPDFEKRVLDGDIYMKGRLRAFHMVMFTAKMLLDKNVRSTYLDIRTFEW